MLTRTGPSRRLPPRDYVSGFDTTVLSQPILSTWLVVDRPPAHGLSCTPCGVSMVMILRSLRTQGWRECVWSTARHDSIGKCSSPLDVTKVCDEGLRP